MARNLNIGSGEKKLENYINLDICENTDPDVVHDLNVLPWPFEDNFFDRVVAFDVIEHVDSIVHFMEEIYRVSKPGASVELTTPHYTCANSFRDPTHKHHLGRFSLQYFSGSHEFGFYSSARFVEEVVRIVFHPSLLGRLVSRLANKFPEAYERRWAWIFPAWFLSIKLKVQKRR